MCIVFCILNFRHSVGEEDQTVTASPSWLQMSIESGESLLPLLCN
jgi:hypothetical protein